MRAVSYHVEAWSSALHEISQHWPGHWHEVALHKETISLEPDLAAYARMEANGELHVSTVRDRGALVGYAVVVIRPHLHYKQSLTGFFDLYYVQPSRRSGWTGVGLFKHVEREMRRRGVQRLFVGTKVHLDFSPIFKRLGYERAEIVHTKLLSPDK